MSPLARRSPEWRPRVAGAARCSGRSWLTLHEQKVPAAGGEEVRMPALAMQRIAGDQVTGQVRWAVQGDGECGDLVAVGDRGLSEYQPAGVVIDAEGPRLLVGGPGSAQGLAVHRQHRALLGPGLPDPCRCRDSG